MAVLTHIQCINTHAGVQMVRGDDFNRVDGRVGEQCVDRVVPFRDAVALGEILRERAGAAHHGHQLAVRDLLEGRPGFHFAHVAAADDAPANDVHRRERTALSALEDGNDGGHRAMVLTTSIATH